MLGVNNKECWELESCTSLLLRLDKLGVLAFPEGPVCPRGMRSPPAAPAGMAVVVLHSVPSLRALLQRCWQRLERSLLPAAWGAQSPPWGLAAACLPGPAGTAGSGGVPGLLDSALWMAAPKKRRSIEVNRCRRRNPSKLIPVKRNIDVCPECGNLKLKHVLCAYCYAKVKAETQLIRKEMGKKEGGPFNAPTVETLVLYDGEKPTEKDEGKRIIERARKRPSWFIQH